MLNFVAMEFLHNTINTIHIHWTGLHYAEEIFATPEAIWSSADGSHIMFASFNDTQVGTMVYPWFDSGAVMAVQSISSTSFPETRTVRYPTPGSRNPDVQLWIANVSNSNALRIWPVKPPITLEGQ